MTTATLTRKQQRSTPRDEERAARERQRLIDRMHRGRQRQVERQQREALARALSDTRPIPCKCGLHSRMSDEEIRALGAGCTAPRWVCSRLDSVRRRLGL